MLNSGRRFANLLRMVASYAVSVFLVSFFFVGSFVVDALNWSVSDLAGAVFALIVSFMLIAFVLGLPVLLVAGLTLIFLHDEIAQRRAFWCVISPLIVIVIYAPIDLVAFNPGTIAYTEHFSQSATFVRFAYAAGVASLTAMIFYFWTERVGGDGANPAS